AQNILGDVREPVRVDGIEILPSASIGVAPSPQGTLAASELLRRADVAMYQAKQQRVGVALYDPADDDFSKHKLMLADELRKALDEHQLELGYQPQVDATTLRFHGVEALLRWRRPGQGIVSPVEFLPAARHAGLMPAISDRVAELAVSDLREFRAAGLDMPMA